MAPPAKMSGLPIRIGAIVREGGVICGGCWLGHQQEPHRQPNCRFALLVWMPIMEQAPPAMRAMPFVGGPHTPPAEINSVQMADDPAVQHLVRFLHRN